MIKKERLAYVRRVKAFYEKRLLRKANVVGVGLGLRTEDGEPTDELALVVSVTHKVPEDELRPRDRIPDRIAGVPVEVQVVGEIQAHSF